MTDPTARLASNTPLDVEDKRIMDVGISEKVPLLCHIRKTPNVLYGIFLELTKQFYSSYNNIPINTCAHWDEDPTKGNIWLGTDYDWEDAELEIRPAIYIKLEGLSYSSLTGRHDSKSDMDLEQGEYKYSRNGQGKVSWVHVGSSNGEALVLSGSTLDYLDAFSDVIRKDFKFQTFEIVNVAPLSSSKESRERFRSSVTASFSFQDTWSLKLESQKLKKVIINAGQGLFANVIL